MGNHHIDCDYCHRDTRGLGAVKGCYSRDEADKCWNYNPPAPCDEQPSAEDAVAAEPGWGAWGVPDGQAPDRIQALLTQVETLTRERDEALREHADMMRQRRRSDERAVAVFADLQAAEARALTAEAERDALRTQLRAAREALEPFADEAARYDCPRSGSPGLPDTTEVKVPLGHLRSALCTARSLLNPRSGANG